MLKCAIVGEPESGKHTFIGLLYLACLRLQQENDSFQFDVPTESHDAISTTISDLRGGRFPSQHSKNELTEIQMDYYMGRSLGNRFVSIFKKTGTSNGTVYSLMDISPLNITSKDITRLRDNDVIILIVDCKRILHERGMAMASPSDFKYERALSVFLDSLRRVHVVDRHKSDRLVIIFTKFDSLNKKVLKSLNILSHEVPLFNDREERQSYCRKIIKGLLPSSYNHRHDRLLLETVIEGSSCFFSRVLIRKDASSSYRIMRTRKSEKSYWGPAFSYPEYIALLAHLNRCRHT